MPLSFSITNEQKVTGITINPTTLTGKPAQVEAGSVTVAIIDGNTNSTGVIEADGSITVASGDGDTALGTTTLVVSADSDLGAGVVTISDAITLNVAGALAANIGLGGGTIVTK